MDPIYPNLHPNQMDPGQYAQQPQGQYIQQPQPGQYIQQPQPGQYVQQPTPGQYVQQPHPGQYLQQPSAQVTGLHNIQPYVQPAGQIIQPQPGPSLEPQGQPNMKPVGTTNTKQAATGGAKYGGGEAGSALGGLCCPVIGSIIGNCVGEKVGEKVMVKTGLDKKVTQGGDKLAGVIGRRNVDKAGDIAMTAFGYAESETCVCCPCLPASQILLVLAIPFFFFNFYKLGVGVSWDWGCSKPENMTDPEPDEGSGLDPLEANATETAPLIYPCQQGFHYLVVSGAVWLTFLPCWICGLFGNCWRQCCCCCCDPIVLVATITDFIKRCCCECGRFNLCSFFWYTLCAFHVIWAITAIIWLISDVAKAGEGDWIAPREVWGTVVASVVMDFVLAGSEIFHRIRLLFKSNETKEDIEMVEQSQKLNSGPQHPNSGPQHNQNSNTVQPQGQYLSTVTTQPHQSYTVPPQAQYSGMPQQ